MRILKPAERLTDALTDPARRERAMAAALFLYCAIWSLYGADKPSTLAEYSPYLSPWADDARIARDGMAIMCEAGDPTCLKAVEIFSAISPGGRRAEVTLTRGWLGFESAPRRFTIATIPPRQ